MPPRRYPDELEFPPLRAHVYHSAPRETLRTGLKVLFDSPDITEIIQVSMMGQSDTESALATVRLLPAGIIFQIALDALPLGPNHTRLVLRCLTSSGQRGCQLLLAAVQSAMDDLIDGG